MMRKHEDFMRECLRLAEQGRPLVSPNPMVGAVLVRDGRIIARGWHREFGAPHAEADCLRKARGDLRRATMYVNLEPCSHTGKTPPCADLIVNSGIRHIVVAMEDPNPKVAGRGLNRLRNAGVRVTLGVLRTEARALNRVFIHHITRRRPYVHLKIAQSLDGFVASPMLHTRWITSPQSRQRVHALRAQSDAVLVGAGTVRIDNPRLTVRHAKGRDPAVVILSGRRSIPKDSRVFRGGRDVFVLTPDGSRGATRLRHLESKGVRILRVPGKQGRVPLRLALREIYKENIGSLLVEGGADVFGQFLRDDLVDELTIFLAPLGLGSGLPVFGGGKGLPRAISWFAGDRVSFSVSGRDIVLHALRRED